MGILCVFCVYDTIGNRCFEKTSFPKSVSRCFMIYPCAENTLFVTYTSVGIISYNHNTTKEHSAVTCTCGHLLGKG